MPESKARMPGAGVAAPSGSTRSVTRGEPALPTKGRPRRSTDHARPPRSDTSATVAPPIVSVRTRPSAGGDVLALGLALAVQAGDAARVDRAVGARLARRQRDLVLEHVDAHDLGLHVGLPRGAHAARLVIHGSLPLSSRSSESGRARRRPRRAGG